MNLFSGSQDYESKVRDALVNTLITDKSVVSRNYIPCNMFLEGEYWGVFFLVDKLDEQFFRNQYDVREEDVIMIKNGYLEIGVDSDIDEYYSMISCLLENDMSVTENYEHAEDIVDIDSLAEYYAIMIYIGRYNDWKEPNSNIGIWKTRSSDTGGYSDGKWRWIVFDLNSGSSSPAMAWQNTLLETINQKSIFENLCRNEEFVNLFKRKVMYVADNYFAYNNVVSLIDYYEMLLTEPMKKNNMRYFGNEVSYTSPYDYAYQNNMEYIDILESIKSFYSTRREIVEGWVSQSFGSIQ